MAKVRRLVPIAVCLSRRFPFRKKLQEELRFVFASFVGIAPRPRPKRPKQIPANESTELFQLPYFHLKNING